MRIGVSGHDLCDFFTQDRHRLVLVRCSVERIQNHGLSELCDRRAQAILSEKRPYNRKCGL